jgi:hypothetical protein
MSNYIIVSERVGKPGEPFIPEEGVNVEALIAGGFIKTAAAKSAKTNNDPETEK